MPCPHQLAVMHCAASAEASDVFRMRESAVFEAPKTRPLYVKLEQMLDLMFRWATPLQIALSVRVRQCIISSVHACPFMCDALLCSDNSPAQGLCRSSAHGSCTDWWSRAKLSRVVVVFSAPQSAPFVVLLSILCTPNMCVPAVCAPL